MKSAVILEQNPNRMSVVVPRLTHIVKAIIKRMCIIVFLVFFPIKSVIADTLLYPDLKLGFNGRSYPVGAQIVGNLGANYRLWGDSQTWKYGYLRGGLNLMTSVVVNRAGLEFSLFPVSIVGITVGYDTGARNYVPKFLDCNLYECTGRVDRKRVSISAIAAYEDFSMMMLIKYEELRGFGSATKPVYDETTLLIGQRSGEAVFTLNPILLYRTSERTNIGVTSLYSHAIDTGGYSNLYGPLMTYTPKAKMNVVVGLGLNSSPVVQSGLCGFMMFHYNIISSLSVMELADRSVRDSSIQDASESPKQ